MPVSFLTVAQRESYGCYAASPTPEELARFFCINDDDRLLIDRKRGVHNKLGFAVQLGTVRFLGRFLDDPLNVPSVVLQAIAKQLDIVDFTNLQSYCTGEQRWTHNNEIRNYYGYCDITDPKVGFRFTRWLCALCWTGTNRPGVLFDRAKNWLLTHKILLPGISVLERLIARVRSRMEKHLCGLLIQGITPKQRGQLNNLLTVPSGSHCSLLEQIRSGPTRISAPSLIQALLRLQNIRDLSSMFVISARIPPNQLSILARFAATAKVTAIIRLPLERRLATLIAFIHWLEAAANDDVLDVLCMMLKELFNKATRENKEKRLRTLKDLDQAALQLADTSQLFLDAALLEGGLRLKAYEQIPLDIVEYAIQQIRALVQPQDNVHFNELETHYRGIRRFVPTLLKHLHLGASPAGETVMAAFNWMKVNEPYGKAIQSAPREVIKKNWRRQIIGNDNAIDHRAYTFCVLDELHKALNRRDIFVAPSWRYADPRLGLLDGEKWETVRLTICRTLGFSNDPQPVLTAFAKDLDQTYRTVIENLLNNPAIRFEKIKGKTELVLTPLDKLDEPSSLVELRKIVMERLPRVDLPEILLEIAARTKFTDAFTHISEKTARMGNLSTSLCAVLLAEACNTGVEPLIRNDIPALKRDRLSWVDQNYIRDDTLRAANAVLVAAQDKIPLAHDWGGGEVASADGIRFVVPVKTIHAGYNPKYFGPERGVTWYNLISNQFSGLNAITVPGTLKDSLILLAVVLEQQTELQPVQIMTDTGAYSDVVFGLFRLLGYRFSPRLADISGTRFWRIDPHADYAEFNEISRQKVNTKKIAHHWDDFLRLAGSLRLGLVPATGIMRILHTGEQPTRLAQALAEFGRIEKTLHILTYINDEEKRRETLIQLNRGEGRHSLARTVFFGKRGELRQQYREGQEDQLGALGLVLNIIVLWNTIYIDAVLTQLRKEGYNVRNEDVARLSPLIYDHINMLGRYSFIVPDAVIRGELRELRNPGEISP